MTKHDRDDRAKVRFVFLEVEGGSAALQETVRTFANTLARPAAPRSALLEAANGVHAPPAKPMTKAPAEVVVAPPPQGSLFTPDEVETGEVDEPVAPSRPKAARTVPSPKVVDIDFDSGPISLEAFCEQKKPDSDNKRYLVCAVWLKEHRKMDSVTMNEMFTCYRRMKWSVPADPSQPLRDMKRKQNLFGKAEGKGAYAINHLGENEVAKMGVSS